MNFDCEPKGARLAVFAITARNQVSGTFITRYERYRTPEERAVKRPTPIKNDGTRYHWKLDYDPAAAAGNGQFQFSRTMPAGRVLRDLVDFTDMLPTFAELAGAPLPAGVKLDGRSFAPQLRGKKGTPRQWVFSQLGNQWFVRDDGWKLNERGELFDISDAPFAENPVSSDSADAPSIAARKRLEAVLAELNPAAGKTEPPPQAKQPKP